MNETLSSLGSVDRYSSLKGGLALGTLLLRPTSILIWNMHFTEFSGCPAKDDMFVTAVAFTVFDAQHRTSHQIEVAVTSVRKVFPGCMDDNAICLGNGSLRITIDGDTTIVAITLCRAVSLRIIPLEPALASGSTTTLIMKRLVLRPLCVTDAIYSKKVLLLEVLAKTKGKVWTLLLASHG